MWDERRYFFKMLRNLQRKQDASPVVLQVTTDNQQVALFVSCDLQGHCLPEWPSKSSLLTEEKIAVQSLAGMTFLGFFFGKIIVKVMVEVTTDRLLAGNTRKNGYQSYNVSQWSNSWNDC
jgi:hypothetical protein